MRTLVLIFTILFSAAAVAQEHARDDLIRDELPTHTLVTSDAMRDLGARLAATVVGVRTTTDLGPGHNPQFLTNDGAATWVRLVAEEAPVLLTSYAHVAQAASVEVQIDDVWHDATVTYGTPMFDLAVLQVPEAAPPTHPLPLSEEWPMGLSVFAPSPVLRDARSLRSELGPPVRVGTLGDAPREPYSFYVRALFDMRNGYPMVSLNGELLGVMSLPAPGRAGGTLTIPFQHIHTWRAEWDQLNPNTPIGWTPSVRHEEIDLETGDDALR